MFRQRRQKLNAADPNVKDAKLKGKYYNKKRNQGSP